MKTDPSRQQPRTKVKGHKEEKDLPRTKACHRSPHLTFSWLDNIRNLQKEAVCNRKKHGNAIVMSGSGVYFVI